MDCEENARKEVKNKLRKLILQTKSEIKVIEESNSIKTQKSFRNLTFDFKVFDDWLVYNLKNMNIDGPGSGYWLNSFVRITDYLATSNDEKINALVITELLDHYIPYIETNP